MKLHWLRENWILVFHCPACKYSHPVHVKESPHAWSWNGSMDKPTFSPSLKVNPGGPNQCHSTITDGYIRFYDDCDHDMKGMTVEIPDWDDTMHPQRISA